MIRSVGLERPSGGLLLLLVRVDTYICIFRYVIGDNTCCIASLAEDKSNTLQFSLVAA